MIEISTVAFRYSRIVAAIQPHVRDRPEVMLELRRGLWDDLAGKPGTTLEFIFDGPWPGSTVVEFIRCARYDARTLIEIMRANPGLRERSGYQGMIERKDGLWLLTELA